MTVLSVGFETISPYITPLIMPTTNPSIKESIFFVELRGIKTLSSQKDELF